MASLDDFLRLEAAGSALGGSSPLETAIRPTASGLKWLTAASGVVGLAYRYVASGLERLEISEDKIVVTGTCPLETTAVQMSASPDGRLLAVAGADGSLHCFDSTGTASISPRWQITNAHSHVVRDNPSTSPSSDRSNAASASGPVRSLAFSSSGYYLLIVDNTSLYIYNAAEDKPSKLASLENITSASWCSMESDNNATNKCTLAAGTTDGSVNIYNFDATSARLEAISQLGCPSEETDFVCSHLDWEDDTLVAGLCRVIPADEEPDEDEEDDTADHEACLYMTTIDTSTYSGSEWSDHGDVVPFFTVPKCGRHAYFTSILRSNQNLVIVAANVGSDIGTLAQEGSDWQLVEFQEGAAATTPTDEEDEYYFPVGVEVIQLASSEFRLLLASTDGSLSLFKFENEDNPSCFATSKIKSTAPMPATPVELVGSASSPPDLANEPPSEESKPDQSTTSAGTSGISLGSGSSSTFPFGKPAAAPSPFGTASTTTSLFGASSSSTRSNPGSVSSATDKPSKSVFGSGAAPIFGSGSASGLTFGKGMSTNFSFGSSGFGATSPLGGGSKTNVLASENKPSIGPSFGSATFGSASGGVSGGGFGALAAAKPQTGAFGSDQFNAFAKPAGSTTGMPVKPLFGNTAPKDPGFRSNENSFVLKQTSLGTAPQESSKVLPKSDPKTVSTDTTTLSIAGKKAARVFDNMDKQKEGKLPNNVFEELLEELGEGFHGAEYEAQIKLIDPAGSGILLRRNFIDWYTMLAEGGDDDDDDSDDSERAEEEERARKCFGELSTVENGVRVINVSDMEKLITNLGSTYGEDEFKKVVKKLVKPGNKIHEADFIAWFLSWLFDDDGSDFEDDDIDEDKDGGTDAGSSLKKDLSSLFKVDEDSWKCENCFVRNKGDAKKCAACETPRPGYEDDPVNKADVGSGGAGAGSIGSGGFSFGGGGSGAAIGSSGFSFGGGSGDASKDASAGDSKVGFTFGSSATTAGTSLFGTAGTSGSGFNFGSTKKATETDVSKETIGLPFGALSKPTSKAGANASSSAAFPPMSSKAPTPFGKTAKAGTSASSSAAFRPMSTKAPTPFGATAKAGTSASSSAAFPPMSAKAPTPFGATAKSTTTKASSAAAFPPMSTKAPTPFGATAKSTTSKVSSSAAFPPMSAKAPTPFGATAKSTTTKASSAAFPPMSAKAPTPFGATAKAGSNIPSIVGPESVSAKRAGSFGGRSEVKSSSLTMTALTAQIPTQNVYSNSTNSKRKGSEYRREKDRSIMLPGEKEFNLLEEKMGECFARLEIMKEKMMNKTTEMEEKINGLVGKVQRTRLELIDADTKMIEWKEKSIFLLSRKTDASRQVNEARRLLASISTNGKGSADLAGEQPLDYQSEHNRRKFAVEARCITGQMGVLERRIALTEKISGSPEDTAPVLSSVMETYRKTKYMGEAIKRLDSKVIDISKRTPLSETSQDRRKHGRSTYGLGALVKAKTTRRARMRPLSFSSKKTSPATPAGKVSNQIQISSVDTWEKIECALQKSGEQQVQKIRIGGLARLKSVPANTFSDQKQSQRRLGEARSLLLSPAKGSGTPASVADTKRVSIFSPASKSKTRASWDQVSSVDKNKLHQLSFSAPEKLNEVTVSGRAREKLAAVGTTPEKIRSSLRVKEQGLDSKRDSSSSGAVSSGSESKVSIKSGSAAFPPLSSKAPTPFSQKLTDSKDTSQRGGSSTYPPISSTAPKPFSQTQKPPKSNPDTSFGSSQKVTAGTKKPESKKTNLPDPSSAPSSSFAGMGGLGKSLFNSEKGTPTQTSSLLPPKSPAPNESSSSPDYHQLLTKFYQQYNPSKVAEVAKTLSKYKGREQEMFKKLAAKYKVPSPLDNLSTAQSSSVGGSVIPGSSFATPKPKASPFSSAGNLMSTSSPFGSSTNASATPFGAPKPGGMANSSPFDKSAAAANPFGSSVMSSPSPFGSTNSANSQSLGNMGASRTQASPFAATAPSSAPMQTPGAQQSFQGRNPREMLMSFYQQKNPSKVSEVDKVLQKYRGNEEQLFRNLAKKYQMDPSAFGLSTAPSASPFGSQPPSNSGGAFGSSGPTAFGQQSSLGGGPSPFGQSGGFGQTSTLGGGSMTATTGGSFGSTAGSSFGGSSFGTLAQSSGPSPFGAPSANTFGSNTSGFGAPQNSGFGGATPFGAARR